jgi:iron(III) transport system substrate-binding protein
VRRNLPAFVAILVISGSACSSAGENVLHIYTSLDAQEAPVYIDAFEQDTGIEVEWVRLSAGEALARLEAERNNPQVSVWFGGPSPEYIVAAQRGLLEPYRPSLDYPLEPPARADDWAWSGFNFGVIGFACNTTFFSEPRLQCPEDWSALQNPALERQISVAYPYTSGTAYITLVALLEHMGEPAGWNFVKQLDAQVHHYNSSGSAAVTQAGLGEVAVGIAFAHDILKKGIERGYPIALSIPSDGTASEIGAVALVRGGRQQQLGRQFIDWLLGERAQNLLAEFYRVPLNPSARVADGAILARDVDVIAVDAVEAAARQTQILAQWRQVTGR